ncbi:MAG: LON peptidase substrate-binding domain-containing protein, partial [Planctomycetota bacterium]
MSSGSAERGTDEQVRIPDELPILPLRDTVVYPFIIAPLSVAREISIQAVDQALAENRMILLTAQRDKDEDEPGEADLFRTGTVAVIMRMLKLPDGRIRVLVQGVSRARITEITTSNPFFQGRIERLQDADYDPSSIEKEAMMRSVKELLDRAAGLGKNLPSEVMAIANNLEDPGRLADLTASNLELKVEEAQEVLEFMDPQDRLKRVHDFLKRELDLLSMQREIDSLARDEMDRTQRESYLRHQMKAIMEELGEGNEVAEEAEQYRRKAKKLCWAAESEEEFERQLRRMERMHPDSSEATTVRNYLDWMTALPWGQPTRDNLNLRKAATILDEDHYGLEQVKDRILEYLAVRKLSKKSKGPVLCFVGPPGVGKTSLGRSIARALGRKFVRLSLGGVKDEAEIRGHRRTYVGAMPGRIIQGMHQAASSNPT